VTVDGPANSPAAEIAKLRGRLDDLLSAVARPGLWADGAPPDDVRAFLEAMPEVIERITQETTALAAANALSTKEGAERRRAEDPPRDSRVILDTIPGLVAILTPTGAVDVVNHELVEYCGQPLEAMKQWGANGTVHALDLPRVAALFTRSIASGEPYDFEARIRRFDGYRWCQVRGLPLRNATGVIIRWFVLLTDVDERKRAEALLDGENRLLQMVASGCPLRDVLEKVCGLVEAIVSNSTCSILLIEPNGTFLLGAGPTLPPGYDDMVRGVPVACETGPCGTAASLKQRVVVPDLASDPRWVGLGWRTLALEYGLKSVCSTPIVSVRGRVLGTFAIYQREPEPPIALLNDLIARFTHIASIAIERAITESELQERERELRMIVDTIPGLIGVSSTSGEVEVLNQRMLEYFGKPLEEMRHWEENDIFHPADLPRAIRVFAQSLESQQPLEYEARLRRFDGVYRWFQVRSLPARHRTGRVAHWYSLITDIDDLKRAEDALRASERSLELIVNTIPALAWSARPDGRAEFFNQHYLNFTGLSAAEASGWGWTVAVHPEDVNQLAASWQRIMASNASGEAEARLRQYDGCYRWFVFRANPLRDETGTIVKWYGVNIDIEDRKRAEAELGALKDQLQRENLVLRDEVDRTSMFEEIVGMSPALQPVLAHVAKVARTDSTVLVTGETGTGKELVARALHRRSARGSRPFVSVNCAAVPRELIASEFFGHEKGAFTGATQRRLGRFELAHGGTIFLDEVGDLPMEIQVALLRVLQEREFERVGGNTSVHVDVRVIAATNYDLQAAIEAGTFRSDLFYRLNVFPIAVPPLRKRGDDIPLLVEYFIDRYARKVGKTIRRVDKQTLEHMRSYPWPGNVRELQNVVERSVILCETDEFKVDESWLSAAPATKSGALSNTLASHERAMIEDALRASRGRVFGPSGAAALLGIARSTLESKIRGLGIDKNRFRSRSAMK
jgi:PAS domain S-box-containing protein